MSAKEAIGWLAMAFGITAAALSGAYLLLDLYWYALIALAVTVVCMETRVRLGFRNPRKARFYIHLVASIGLLATLYALTRMPQHAALTVLAYLCFIVMAVSGGILLHRTHKAAEAARAENVLEAGD